MFRICKAKGLSELRPVMFPGCSHKGSSCRTIVIPERGQFLATAHHMKVPLFLLVLSLLQNKRGRVGEGGVGMTPPFSPICVVPLMWTAFSHKRLVAAKFDLLHHTNFEVRHTVAAHPRGWRGGGRVVLILWQLCTYQLQMCGTASGSNTMPSAWLPPPSTKNKRKPHYGSIDAVHSFSFRTRRTYLFAWWGQYFAVQCWAKTCLSNAQDRSGQWLRI